MKTVVLALLTCSLLAFTFRADAPGTLTKDERATVVKYLTETQAFLEAEVKGLSDAQLNWKAGADRWSIAH
jgi:hypothetical protein